MFQNMTDQACHASHQQHPGSYQLATPPLTLQVPLAISREVTPGAAVKVRRAGTDSCDPQLPEFLFFEFWFLLYTFYSSSLYMIVLTTPISLFRISIYLLHVSLHTRLIPLQKKT